jgi:hypothetical protein
MTQLIAESEADLLFILTRLRVAIWQSKYVHAQGYLGKIIQVNLQNMHYYD